MADLDDAASRGHSANNAEEAQEEAQDEVDDDVIAEESPTQVEERPKEARRRFFGLCTGGLKANTKTSVPLDSSRQKLLWEFSVSINRFQFVGSESHMPCFFAVSLQPTRAQSKSVRLLAQYSPKYGLDKTGPLVLSRPSVFYERKAFRASQSELGKLELKVAMWRVNPWTFNTYHGVATRTLEQILSREANTSILLQETLTAADREEKKKHKRPISDVAVVYGEVVLEEVFDVKLFFENWKFFPDNQKVKQKKEDKQLTFVVPKNFQANPSKNQKCQVVQTNWRGDGSSLNPYFWKATTQIAKIRGTRRAIQQMFFIAKLFSSKPVNDRHPVAKFVASTVFNLQSVLDIPNFKGTMKALTHEEAFFRIGRVEGSVTCIFFSVGQSSPSKTEIFQPRTSSSVGHLNSSEMHLVITVQKCESLAIADEDKGVSSPFLRVSWDNMMQTSFVLKNTIRPTFNHAFYFPVRFFNEKIMSRKYLETAFLYEMKSKGDIQIQVWHQDDASSTSLGFTTVSLVSVLTSNHEIKCTLRGRVKSSAPTDGEELEIAKPRASAWYNEERAVRWFDGSRTPLVGCQIANPHQPLVHFEAFFYPAWPTDFHNLAEFQTEEADGLDWLSKETAFIEKNEIFAENFAGPFPDSIGAKRCTSSGATEIRSFPCIGLHPMNLEALPLMAFLCETSVNQDYIQPSKLLHWMHCVTYTMSTKQERTGLIFKEMWKDPQYLLFCRKGSPQDHAVLLCSVLLGMSRDAYVVKGTIQVPTGTGKPKLVEHVWVMTREDGGWVTFWEPSTREFYHLPNRWVETKKKRTSQTEEAETKGEEEEDEEDETMAMQEFTSHEVGDVMVELDGVPTVGRAPRAKAKAKMGREMVKQQMLETQRFLPTAPKSQLLGEDKLVDWLPYDSIDVIFNKSQLWANRQNQHPACITYNFEDSYPVSEATSEATGTWMTLMSDEERSSNRIKYVTDNVLMEPSLKHSQIQQLEDQLVTEAQENLRLLRGRIGKDTVFDHRPPLLEQLDQFLEIHELIATLDVDFCPLWGTDSAKWTDAESYLAKLLAPRLQEPFNKFGTAFKQPDTKGKYRYYSTIQAAEHKGWHQVLEKINSFKEGKSVFPTIKGKVFSGFPLHFSSADKDLVRDYVKKASEYQELIQMNDDSVLFTIHCQIYPLPGGISSTWLFFGTQSPLKDT